MVEMDLRPIPADVAPELEELLADPWLSEKVDRKRRLIEKDRYISDNLPEITRGGFEILDLGTGTGEFLEFCRLYDNFALGIEKVHDLRCRWSSYTRYSRINWSRQGLIVKNYDVRELVMKEKSEFDGRTWDVINCQHAINFIFSEVFDFRFDQGKKNNGVWLLDERFDHLFGIFFRWVFEHLSERGLVLISALRAENAREYSARLERAAAQFGLMLVMSRKNLVHKFKKI